MSKAPSIHLLASGAAAREAADISGNLLRDAGLDVGATRAVKPKGLEAALRQAAGQGDVVVIVGGMGLGAQGATRAALQGILHPTIPGFSDLYRLVSFRDLGADALLNDAMAGYASGALVIALPADVEAVERAIEDVLIPTLPSLLRAAAGTASLEPAPPAALGPHTALEPPEAGEPDSPDDAEGDDDAEDDGEPKPPPPEPRWRLGATRVSTEAAPIEAEPPTDPEGEEIPDRGWKRAVYDLEAEVVRGKNPDTPQNLEDFAPFMDILYQAGERARLELPSGVKLDLYGYPDLQRAGSKVLAVGWGEPLAEVIALHRYPVQAGLCIEEARGLMPARDADLKAVAEAVTGRAPPNTSGELFAVDHDAVYIQRGKWVFKWDGRRERQEGNPKQTLVTLALGWHHR
ncbi:MAG: hypothetical protein EA397_19375 [Deltaproteobacteria bacterium]|nr:MAG: hypothetical protein EA397_19375 [Deltaproteobacteria bacterium]